jgi:hypothetical protein
VTVTAVKPQAAPTPVKAAVAPPAKPKSAVAPPRPKPVPLTPMRRQAAKSMRTLASHVQHSHPDMTVHDHLRDAARTLESGNEEASQRHLRAAMFALTPQSLMRNGLHTDDAHQSAREAMHGVHRHLLLVKDIADADAKNQAAIRRDSGDGAAVPPPRPDPNAGYGPGALAQKPTVRQPPGDQALNAPATSDGGGSDPSTADPGGPQAKAGKQLAARYEAGAMLDLVGPGGFQHGWKQAGPTAADHDKAAKLHTAAAAKAKSPAARAMHLRRAKVHTQIAQKLRSLSPAPAALAYDWDELASVLEMSARVIDLVGPKGFIHGWIFVGIPGAGQKVTLGSGKNRTGTVERADATHLHVRMADGSVTAIPHHGSGKGELAKVPTAVPQYSSTRAGRDQLNKALVAVGGAAPAKASTPAGKRTQTELLARAVSGHPQLASDEVLNEHVAGMRASLDAGDAPSFGAHRDAVEARMRQHGMMPAGDLKAAAPKGGKRAAGNEKQLSLLGERENGPDKTSGLMKAGDMQEGYQAIGQAPNGIVVGASDPWWMAGPGGTFALSVRGTSGNRQIIPWTGDKQQENEAAALKAAAKSSGGSNYQRALAKTATARALHEAAPLNAPAARPGGPEATAARKAAENVRFEPGLTRGQKEEAEQRLYRAAQHLDAGNHEEAASELDATMHATSLRGGAVIKGSTAAQARDLRDKVRGKSLSTPGLTADGLNMTGAAGGRRAQKAALAQASLADLKAVDAENAHRAALLGKPGQVSATHQLVRDEIASRTPKGATVKTAYSWGDLEDVIELSAKTAGLESTPAPRGKPGGPGLYHVAGQEHTAYFQNVVKALIEKRGMPPAKAYAVAYGALRKWSKGGGGVHPEVSAAATGSLAGEKAKAHSHAGSWDDVLRVLDFGLVPGEPRVPAGSATAGQFSAGGAAAPASQQAAAKAKQPPPQTAKQKAAAAAAAKASAASDAHKAHVAHVAHALKVSTGKAGLLVSADDDRKQAQALIAKRNTLAKELASASGKTSTGQSGSTTSANSTTSTTAPAAASTTASTAPASTASTTASTAKAATTAASTATSATSAAGLKTQITALNTQINQLLTAAKKATAQAATMK